MGYAKSFGVLSRHAGQKTGSTAFVCCQRSRHRGPDQEVSKHKAPRRVNQYTICHRRRLLPLLHKMKQ
jgi:hypothetical protein